ncbi:MAG: molybdenum cofactor biosynthesis protein MoaE [Zavarzinella sp.]
MILLTREPISHQQLLESVHTSSAGAVVLFLGTVRQMTNGRATVALDYEAHEPLAVKQMQLVADETRQRWPVQAISIIHRLGHLELGEASVGIAVSCPHRKEAFAACEYAIDRLKEIVPIWKKENWDDGTTEWVHPTNDTTAP